MTRRLRANRPVPTTRAPPVTVLYTMVKTNATRPQTHDRWDVDCSEVNSNGPKRPQKYPPRAALAPHRTRRRYQSHSGGALMRAAFQMCLGRVTLVSWQHAGSLPSRGLRSSSTARSTSDSKGTYSFQELGIDKDLYNKTSGIRYV